MPRRTYTKTDQAKAVGIAVVKGQRAASRQTGVPVMTINQWFHRPEFVHLRTVKREAVTEDFWAGVQIGLKAVVQGLEGEARLGEKAIALGILYDKHALMSGGVTARTENKSITDGLDDHERQALNDAILGELGRRSDAHTAVPAVGAPVEEGSEAT